MQCFVEEGYWSSLKLYFFKIKICCSEGGGREYLKYKGHTITLYHFYFILLNEYIYIHM